MDTEQTPAPQDDLAVGLKMSTLSMVELEQIIETHTNSKETRHAAACEFIARSKNLYEVMNDSTLGNVKGRIPPAHRRGYSDGIKFRLICDEQRKRKRAPSAAATVAPADDRPEATPPWDAVDERLRSMLCPTAARTREGVMQACGGPALYETQRAIVQQCDKLAALLLEKNRAYGNSALEPKRIFSRAPSVEQIKVRIDDKLARMSTGRPLPDESLDDTTRDLAGYLILLLVARAAMKDGA